MKQKYLLLRDAENALTIKEYAELETGIFSLLCEEAFTAELVTSAMAAGKEALIATLRTHNMYPPAGFAEPLAETVISLFKGGEERRELVFDDMDFISREEAVPVSFEKEEEASDLIDDLLDDDMEEDVYNEDDFEELDDKDKGSIKLAEDEGGVDIDI